MIQGPIFLSTFILYTSLRPTPPALCRPSPGRAGTQQIADSASIHVAWPLDPKQRQHGWGDIDIARARDRRPGRDTVSPRKNGSAVGVAAAWTAVAVLDASKARRLDRLD